MKWIVAVAFGFMSATAFAQTEPEPLKEDKKTEMYHHKGHAGMWKENVKAYEAQLQLTPAQASRWEALNEVSKTEMKALRENTALAREDKKAQMKIMREQKHAELQKILTKEQLAQYKELRKEKIEARKAHKAKRSDRKKSR